MVLNDDLKKKLGTWSSVLEPLVNSATWDNVFAQLKALSKAGKTIIPASGDLFKSFKLCDRNKVKAVVLLQCPYATKKDEKIIANGIPMDCSNIAPYMQPSLHQWYQGLEKAYGFDPENDIRCNLSYLLEEEHILLINSSLSVEYQKVDSHSQLWEPIIRYLLEEVISKLMCGLPIVLVGTQAQRYEKYINPMCHHVLKVEHPAAASRQDRDWNSGDMFQWINRILRLSNGAEYEINWMRKKGEKPKEKETEYPQWVTQTHEELIKATPDIPWED